MKDDKIFANEESFELNPEMLDKVAGGAGMPYGIPDGKGFDTFLKKQVSKNNSVSTAAYDTQFDTYGFLKG